MAVSGLLNTLTALPFAKVPLPPVRVGEPEIRSGSFDQDKDLWTLSGIEEIKAIIEF